ncbi:MAG: hypothetical protein PHG00_16945, partial [Methylococcales bacterium]|nr:hypothetical protein [Methylococcales bacterium]
PSLSHGTRDPLAGAPYPEIERVFVDAAPFSLAHENHAPATFRVIVLVVRWRPPSLGFNLKFNYNRRLLILKLVEFGISAAH